MSSSDQTTLGVHRALHEALNSVRDAQHLAEDGGAAPDKDDLAELGKIVSALSEAAKAVDSAMREQARA